jgi:acetate kinase
LKIIQKFNKMIVLVLNAGSSSLKYCLYQMPSEKLIAKGKIDRIGKDDSSLSYYHGEEEKKLIIPIQEHKEGVALILKQLTEKSDGVIKELNEINAAGHRIVHGGSKFTEDTVINEGVIKSLDMLTDIAPVHNNPGITCIRAAQNMLPHVSHIACFDTVFHKTIPPAAYTYGLPFELCQKYNIRRYGFHGLSYDYVSERTSQFLNKDKNELNAIICHLGNGCSITAIKNGKSIDTSMGFTPLEGLVMGTRCGDIDPEIVFFLMDKGYEHKQLVNILNKESGLIGISEVSNDMRTLQKLAEQGHEQAKLAIDVFTYRIKKYIGAYIAITGNIDALVFTGGIGENSPKIRKQICDGLEHLTIKLDDSLNNTTGTENCISFSRSGIKVLVIPTNEELIIARKTYKLTNPNYKI